MSDDRGAPACPAPLHHDTVQLAHGGGGRLMRQLVERVFLDAFGAPPPAERHDAFVTDVSGRVAITTDGYVVTPRWFPGGDIGSLAVYGTANDLAMSGAEPRWLSAGFILEEGLPTEELERVARSMARAASVAGVRVVTGDTKVVDRGHGHGLYVTTTGIGVVREGVTIAPARIAEGDAVVVSGDLGRHGVAVLSVREGVTFDGRLESDAAPLWPLVRALLDAGIDVHCLRDLTRGGLAAATNELALDTGLDVLLDETAIPVGEAVRGACELFGLDPLYVACEGRFVAFMPERDAMRAVATLRRFDGGREAALIGHASRAASAALPRVTARTALGTERLVDFLSGEQLPRIC